jgi:hypothetical protein
MRILPAALLAFLIGAPAHALTITAESAFDVFYHGGEDDTPQIEPPLEGSGFFHIVENRIAEFRFTMLGFTWTLEDLPDARCSTLECEVSPDFRFITPEIRVIHFEFSDEQGSGSLTWAFPPSGTTQEGNFLLSFQAGEFNLHGSSINSSAGGPLRDFTGHVNIPEPGTLALLGFGLLVVALTRARWRGSRPRAASFLN